MPLFNHGFQLNLYFHHPWKLFLCAFFMHVSINHKHFSPFTNFQHTVNIFFMSHLFDCVCFVFVEENHLVFSERTFHSALAMCCSRESIKEFFSSSRDSQSSEKIFINKFHLFNPLFHMKPCPFSLWTVGSYAYSHY